MRRGTARGRRRSGAGAYRGAPALVLASVLLLAACSDAPTLVPGELTEPRFKLTVSVTNVGTGFGRAEVVFSAGPAQNPCTVVLGPSQSCSPFVVAQVRPETAEIIVFAEAGSRFVGWTGTHCTGTSGECTVQNVSGDYDVRIAVEPRFDLVTGG